MCANAHTHTRTHSRFKSEHITLGCTMYLYTSHKSPIRSNMYSMTTKLNVCVFVRVHLKSQEAFHCIAFYLDGFICMYVSCTHCTLRIFLLLLYFFCLSIYNCALAHCCAQTDFFCSFLYLLLLLYHSLNCTTQFSSHR